MALYPKKGMRAPLKNQPWLSRKDHAMASFLPALEKPRFGFLPIKKGCGDDKFGYF
jgi:hypothetical protein